MYTPRKTVTYESRIRNIFRAKYPNHTPLREPLVLFCVAVFPIPAKAKKADIELMLDDVLVPTKKPDWDNIGKITDALNRVAWLDDNVVVDGHVFKRYGKEARLEIWIFRYADFYA